MKIFNTGYEIVAQRWPGQEADKGFHDFRGFGRFGGGWNYKLGIDIGGKTVIVNLLLGLIQLRPISSKIKDKR